MASTGAPDFEAMPSIRNTSALDVQARAVIGKGTPRPRGSSSLGAVAISEDAAAPRIEKKRT